MMQSYVKAAILFVLGAGLISIVDNVMKPALIGERTKLPFFLLFFGILGGIKLYGLLGIFLAPVILSLFFALVKIFQEKFS
jgi:predicted PurR-regulated permease PerM